MYVKIHHLIGRSFFALALVCGLLSPAYADEPKVVKNPEKDTPEYTLLEGLKAIDAGKEDEFISKWCSKEELCFNETSIKSLKRYNIPTIKKLTHFCLNIKGNDMELHITKTEVIGGDEKEPTELKIFVRCKEGGMPRPFKLIKEKGRWLFENL